MRALLTLVLALITAASPINAALFKKERPLLEKLKQGKEALASIKQAKSKGQKNYIEDSIYVNDKNRWYRIYKPKNLRRNAKAVVLMHGGRQGMRDTFDESNISYPWLQLAEEKGFLLIIPNGTNFQTGNTRGNNQSWNDLRNKGNFFFRKTNDDVEFVTSLVSKCVTDYKLDSSQIFLVGNSNGAAMVYRLLLEAPEFFAGAATFIFNLRKEIIEEKERLKFPVPILIGLGTEDPGVPWEGGTVGFVNDNMNVISGPKTVAWWVLANRAGIQKESIQFPDKYADGCKATLTKFESKAKNQISKPVYFYKLEGGGHFPPTNYNASIYQVPKVKEKFGNLCRELEWTDISWNFFQNIY